MDDNAQPDAIPAGTAARNVTVLAGHRAIRRRPELMVQLLDSLELLDPERAAQARRIEAFRVKSAINTSVALLVGLAGHEAAQEFLRETMATLERAGAEG